MCRASTRRSVSGTSSSPATSTRAAACWRRSPGSNSSRSRRTISGAVSPPACAWRTRAFDRSARAVAEADAAVRLHQTIVQNEQRKFQLGVSTLFDVMQAEDGLTSAMLGEMPAARVTRVAMATLRFQTGTLLTADTRGPAVDVANLLRRLTGIGGDPMSAHLPQGRARAARLARAARPAYAGHRPRGLDRAGSRLAVVLATAVVWGIAGAVPQNVGGTASSSRAAACSRSSRYPAAGSPTLRWRSATRSCEGQVVARLAQPELMEQLREAKAVLGELRDQHRETLAYGSRTSAQTALLARAARDGGAGERERRAEHGVVQREDCGAAEAGSGRPAHQADAAHDAPAGRRGARADQRRAQPARADRGPASWSCGTAGAKRRAKRDPDPAAGACHRRARARAEVEAPRWSPRRPGASSRS